MLSDASNSYIYGPGGIPIEQIDGSRAPTYYHHDELGSTRLLTEARGAATATFSYAPYGALTGTTGTQTTPLGFAGQYTDAETGFQYLHARYYDPGTGQLITRDPLSAVTSQPYAYANGNPLANVDPAGELSVPSLGDLATRYVGFVDGVTFGATSTIRGQLGLNGGLDTCSVDYRVANQVGNVTGIVESLAGVAGALGLLGEGASAPLAGDLEGGTASPITGYTRHGLASAIAREGRGVSPSAILDAVRSPLKVITGTTTKYVGEHATVVLNESGQVVTAWPTDSSAWRIK